MSSDATMQLKLKVASGDEISVDVKPTDSFQDLTDRLSQYGNIKIDLSELGPATGKTFHLSANVFEFFDVKKDNKKEDKTDDIFATLCRICGESVGSTPHYLFEETGDGIPSLAEKINAAIPIQVLTNEFVPQQICSSCFNDVNEAYSTMRKAVQAQETLEKMCKTKKFDEIQGDCCPLCNGQMKCFNQTGLAASIACTSKGGREAEDASDEGEIVIGLYDLTVNSSVNRPAASAAEACQTTIHSSRGRYKRKNRAEDDEDWTIDQEYVPVSRRGRPKGTKTKSKPVRVIQRKCLLCFWSGPHNDVLAHAINQHCQPDMNYFPCPLCKYKQENEIELENHIEFHLGQYKGRQGTGPQIVSGEGT